MKYLEKILIVDIHIEIKGHYISYNQFLLDHYMGIEKLFSKIEIHFLYNYEAKSILSHNHIKDHRVNFFEPRINNKNNFYQNSLKYKNVIEFANENKIDQVILMDFDRFQIPVFLYTRNVNVSGILFRPHHRISSTTNKISEILKIKIRRQKKKLLERLLILNKFVTSIYILNDKSGVNFLNNYFLTNKFKYLPDPIFTKKLIYIQVERNKIYKFMILGSIVERKNILNIIEGYSTAIFKNNTELYIIGTGNGDYYNKVVRKIEDFEKKYLPGKQIIFIEKFISDQEMDQYFHLIDACLLIYNNFYGSSGLLGRSALHYKKVIGPNVGLMAEIIKEYELGLLCNPNNIEQIADVLVQIQEFELNLEKSLEFQNENTPEMFIKTLLIRDKC